MTQRYAHLPVDDLERAVIACFFCFHSPTPDDPLLRQVAAWIAYRPLCAVPTATPHAPPRHKRSKICKNHYHECSREALLV